MKKLMEDKLSATMKEALTRNAQMENKMKANMGAISLNAKKNLQSFEFYKHKYQARQKELQNEKQRMIFSEKGARKISAPSRLMMSVEYKDLSSVEIVTDLTEFRKGERSISDTVMPPIFRRESGWRLPELAVNSKTDALALPIIGELNVNNDGRPRRLSATSMGCLSTIPGPGFLAVPSSANIGQSRSAPSSPCTPRRADFTRVSSPSCRRKSSTGDFGKQLSLQLDKVLKQNVPYQEVAMGNIKGDGHMRSLELEEQVKQNTKKVDVPKTRKISSPGTTLHSFAPKAGKGEGQTSLEESMDDLRFCKYLRTPSMEENHNERLPDELVPKVIIVGHSEWVPVEIEKPR